MRGGSGELKGVLVAERTGMLRMAGMMMIVRGVWAGRELESLF